MSPHLRSKKNRQIGKNRQVDLEKVTNHICPRCGKAAMNIYYSEGSEKKVGAWCELCDLKGFFSNNKLFSVEEIYNV